jgi:LysR family transcriptional regulator, positive regulator for ilvC
MDFHELEAFLALADSLHFAHAAVQVHISPSALSRLLGRLEEELGVMLFERDTRRVSLTKDGLLFQQFCRETLHRRDDLRLRIGEQDDRLRGILRIYASVTACYSILPPFVETLTREHPELHLSVQTGDPSNAADAIREGRAELGLDALPPGGFRDLECHSVQRTPLVFATSTTGIYGTLNLRLDGIPVSTNKMKETISSIPFILPKTGLARERFERWTKQRGIKPNIAAETAGNEAILALCRLGLGLGLVPRLVLENGPFADGLVIYETGRELGDYDIGFVQKPVETGTETARKFRTAIADIIRRTYAQ